MWRYLALRGVIWRYVALGCVFGVIWRFVALCEVM